MRRRKISIGPSRVWSGLDCIAYEVYAGARPRVLIGHISQRHSYGLDFAQWSMCQHDGMALDEAMKAIALAHEDMGTPNTTAQS